MMRQLSLRSKVMLVLAVALAGCVVVTATGIYSISRLTHVLNTLAQASERVETLQRMDKLTSEISAHEKQMLLELDRPKIRELDEKIQKADAELQRLQEAYREVTAGESRNTVDAMRALLADWRKDDEKVRQLSIAFKNDEARLVHLNASVPKLASFEEKLNALVRSGMEMKAAVGGDARNAEALGNTSILLLAGASIGAVLLSLLAGYLMTRALAGGLGAVIADLATASRQTLHASQQVNSSSQALAQGSSEQAGSLEETSATLQEISAMTRQTVEHMARMEQLVSQARDSAGKGGEAMDLMVQRINLIKDSSDKTARIIKTIDEIAFQTNLLALNAAVEAARAGEAGRGFAVVAEEVRNLALRSAQAARDTSALIEESRQRAEQGVSASGDAQRLLQGIRTTVDDVSGVVRDVASAGQEQSKGVEQITQALTQLDSLTQSNAASAEQNAAASEELSAQSQGLSLLVKRLVELVSGGGAGANGQQGRHPGSSRPKPPPKRVSAPAIPRLEAARAPARTRGAARPASLSSSNLRQRILRDQQGSGGATPGAGKHPAEGVKFRDIQG
jgi:methyl-accepting chemotaxis protein